MTAKLALWFSLTRPNRMETEVPYSGSIPGVVWFFILFYVGVGSRLVWIGARLISRSGGLDR